MGAPVFRGRVVGHYVGRGYRVDADAVLEGESQTKHKVDLMATDDLGRIAVWWGDREPFEGPELESLRRAARDLNAAPAIAAPQVTATLRENARRHGVVIVDEPLLEEEAETMARPLPPRPIGDRPAISADDAFPPWPDPSQRSSPSADEPSTPAEPTPSVQAPWREERAEALDNAPDAGPSAGFEWLPTKESMESVASTSQQRTPRARKPLMPPFWAPVLIGAVALLVLLVLLALFVF